MVPAVSWTVLLSDHHPAQTFKPLFCWFSAVQLNPLSTIKHNLECASYFPRSKGLGFVGAGGGVVKILYISYNFSRIWLEKILAFRIFLKVYSVTKYIINFH